MVYLYILTNLFGFLVSYPDDDHDSDRNMW